MKASISTSFPLLLGPPLPPVPPVLVVPPALCKGKLANA